MPYSTYISVLGFSLVLFHDKAKRTQQGNLLILDTTIKPSLVYVCTLYFFLGPIKNISLFAVSSHFGDIVAVFVVLFPLLDGKLAISLQYYCSGCLPF